MIDLRPRQTVERLTWYFEPAGNAEELARWRDVVRELESG